MQRRPAATSEAIADPFCEVCGERARTRAGIDAAPLLECVGCRIHACAQCRAMTPGHCPACGAAEATAASRVRPAREPSSARRIPRRLAATVVATGVVIAGLGAAWLLPRPTGEVAGLAGTPPAGSARPDVSPGSSLVAAGSPSVTAPSATPSSKPSSTASTATPRPSQPVAGGDGPLAVESAVIRSWTHHGAVRAQVIVRVVNRSDDWLQLPAGRIGYTIRSTAGTPSGSGRFAYAFPQVLAPGATSYLTDALAASFAHPEELASVAIEPLAEPVEAQDPALQTRDVSWSADGAALRGSVVVETSAAKPVERVVTGLVFLDAAGQPLAVLYDPEPRRVEPGRPVAVPLDYPASGPVEPASVASIEAFAFPYSP